MAPPGHLLGRVAMRLACARPLRGSSPLPQLFRAGVAPWTLSPSHPQRVRHMWLVSIVQQLLLIPSGSRLATRALAVQLASPLGGVRWTFTEKVRPPGRTKEEGRPEVGGP